MPGNFKKEDLRITKTNTRLINALSKLLERRSFTQITVNDLCEAAQISRATFYFHYYDKYDLLKSWLLNLKLIILKNETYEKIEKALNDYVSKNARQIGHLIEDANEETSKLLRDFMFSIMDTYIDKPDGWQEDPKYAVLSQFCSGGMLNYFLWQIKNTFPTDLPLMNTYIHDILINLLKWYAE